MNFGGKVAIVTGGAQGIGKAFSSSLLEIGMNVCICDIVDDTVKEFIESLPNIHRSKIMFQRCDVTSFTEFKAVFDKVVSTFERIDLVINNAGILNESEWRKMIEVNLIGVIHGIQLAFEYMDISKGGKGGAVINTASVGGLDSCELSPIYSATKHAVVGLTKSYGTDYHLKRTGVSVNALCPWAVDTTLFQLFPEHCLDAQEARKIIPLLEPLKPEDVAKALIRLLHDEKNGALLIVEYDGLKYANEE